MKTLARGRANGRSLFSMDPLESRTLLSGNLFIVTRGSGSTTGSVGEYTSSGAVINASLIKGLDQPYAIAVSGTDLYVSNSTGVISKYTTAGKLVKANFITGVLGVTSIVVSGSNIFANYNGGNIAEFTTSGAVVDRTLVTGIANLSALAVSGSKLFAVSSNDSTSPNTGKIGVYTTAGATVNANLVTGLNGANGISVSGSNLFVSNSYDGKVSEFTTAGKVVNRALISGSVVGDLADVQVTGSNIYLMKYATFGQTFNGVGEFTTAGATVSQYLVKIPISNRVYRIAIGPAVAALSAKLAGTLPTTVKAGKPATIQPKITVTNVSGAAYNASTTTYLYLSKTTGLSGAIALPGKYSKKLKLAVAAHTSFTLTLTSIPSTVPAGTYHMVAKITDPSGNTEVVASKVTIVVT